MAREEYALNELNRPVTEQQASIDNVFRITADETIRQTYECDERICGCGAKYTVTLTDARIIQRYQDHLCGCKGTLVDSMLFLSDISSIKNVAERRSLCVNGCSSSSCCLCFLPDWDFLLFD